MITIYERLVYGENSQLVRTIRTVRSSRVSVLLTFKKVSVTENWDKSVPLTFKKSVALKIGTNQCH